MKVIKSRFLLVIPTKAGIQVAAVGDKNGLLAAIHGRSRDAPPLAFAFAFLQTHSGFRRNDIRRLHKWRN